MPVDPPYGFPIFRNGNEVLPSQVPMEVFDDLTDVYEAMIDWPKRLANEGPFYRRCFERVGVRCVADVACGTGHHAAMFHSWNLRVEGSDLSPRMIEPAPEPFRRAGRPALAGAGFRPADRDGRTAGRRPVRGQFAGPGGRAEAVRRRDRADARRGGPAARSSSTCSTSGACPTALASGRNTAARPCPGATC